MKFFLNFFFQLHFMQLFRAGATISFEFLKKKLPLKSWKSDLKSCQPAQNQPKSQLLIPKNFSPRYLCILTLVGSLSKSLFIGEKIVTFPASSISWEMPAFLVSFLNFEKAWSPFWSKKVYKFLMCSKKHNMLIGIH